MKKLAQLLDAVVVERPDSQQVEQHLCLDRGYDYSSCWQEAQERGYIPHIPQKDAPIPAPTAREPSSTTPMGRRSWSFLV
ncbi:hypothetical protein H6F96_00235 [Microcoleus sp. FACHB-53]|nr:hypothetical protein [Microcoleus sp. FACHB-53]